MGNVPTINAIPTKYKGTEFRSRTEARWAVFFDELGIEWGYEMEGYDLISGSYLPDFWLPQVNAFLEVKPKHERTDPKWLDLVAMTDVRLFVTAGSPGASEPFGVVNSDGVEFVGYGPWEPEDYQEFVQTFYKDYGEDMEEEDEHARRIKAYGRSGGYIDDDSFFFRKCPMCSQWSIVSSRRLKRNRYSCNHQWGIDYIGSDSGRREIVSAAISAANYRFWNPGGAS